MDIKTAMIVDDSDANQMLTRMQIEDFDPDIDIIQACDGQDALDILDGSDTKPDVIFLDINMPRMNGHEFLAEYSKRQDSDIAVAVLTSSDWGEDKEKAMQYDCVKRYFVKMLDRADIESLKAL